MQTISISRRTHNVIVLMTDVESGFICVEGGEIASLQLREALNGTTYVVEVQLQTLAHATVAVMSQDGMTVLVHSNAQDGKVVHLEWTCYETNIAGRSSDGSYAGSYSVLVQAGKGAGSFVVEVRSLGVIASQGMMLVNEAPEHAAIHYPGATQWFQMIVEMTESYGQTVCKTYDLEVDLGTLSGAVLTVVDQDGTTQLMQSSQKGRTTGLQWKCTEKHGIKLAYGAWLHTVLCT
jgi:hypothetical protein